VSGIVGHVGFRVRRVEKSLGRISDFDGRIALHAGARRKDPARHLLDENVKENRGRCSDQPGRWPGSVGRGTVDGIVAAWKTEECSSGTNRNRGIRASRSMMRRSRCDAGSTRGASRAARHESLALLEALTPSKSAGHCGTGFRAPRSCSRPPRRR
jgi:hypothetical protein